MGNLLVNSINNKLQFDNRPFQSSNIHLFMYSAELLWQRTQTYTEVYSYEDKFKDKCNTLIEEYTFNLVSNRSELINIGNDLSICVGSYHNRVDRDDCRIITVTKDEQYIACLEYSPHNKAIVQAKMKHNRQVKHDDQLFKAVQDFGTQTKFKLLTTDLEVRHATK